MKALVESGDVAELHSRCQRPTDLAFYHIDNGNDPYGIFSMVMTEPLHSLEAGLLPYIMEVLFHHIRGDGNRARLDRLIQLMASAPRQHGTERFPRLNWQDGVTSITNLTGDQKTGKFFAIAMLSNTLPGQEYFTEVLGDANAWRDMNEIFQMLLCYWAWLKRDTYWAMGDKDTEYDVLEAIRTMIHKLTTLWPRATGNGWDLPKVHAQFHVPYNIARFGNQMNVHSGPQEANHIEMQKRPAKNAQRRSNVIDFQIAKRLAERLVIRRAHYLMHESSPPTTVPPAAVSSTQAATKGILTLKRPPGHPSVLGNIAWATKQNQMMLLPHHDDVLGLLIKDYWHLAAVNANGEQILEFPIFTEYNREGTVFRAHNNYRQDGPWIDWAWIDWQEDGEGIGKLLIFIEIPNDGLSVIVFPGDIGRCKQHGILTDLWPLEFHPRSQNPHLQIVSVDCLQHHALMIPFKLVPSFPPHRDDLWLHVHDRDTWADEFHSCD
jgi:hypothetical protein